MYLTHFSEKRYENASASPVSKAAEYNSGHDRWHSLFAQWHGRLNLWLSKVFLPPWCLIPCPDPGLWAGQPGIPAEPLWCAGMHQPDILPHMRPSAWCHSERLEGQGRFYFTITRMEGRDSSAEWESCSADAHKCMPKSNSSEPDADSTGFLFGSEVGPCYITWPQVMFTHALYATLAEAFP